MLLSFPTHRMNRLPFFVYGTLRPGFGFQNFEYTLKEHVTDGGLATVAAASLWHLGGFPGIYFEGNPVALSSASCGSFKFHGDVTGSLLYVADPSEEAYMEALSQADSLEGFLGEGHPDNMYRRIAVDCIVASSGKLVKAWVYESLIDPSGMSGATPVLDGDWAKFVQDRRAVVAGTDWSEAV